MKQQRLIRVIILSLLSVSVMLSSAKGKTLFSYTQPTGRLRGTVTDSTGIGIPVATVLVKSERANYKFVTDANGTYEGELPSDVYSISVAEWTGFITTRKAAVIPAQRMASFNQSRRAAFYLPSSTTTILNFIMIESKGVAVPYPGTKPSETFDDGPTKDIGYESFRLPAIQNAPSELVVQFGEKREKRTAVEYTANLVHSGGSIFADPHPGVVASYDVMTIYANKLRFDKKSFKLKASGNVVIENGKQRSRAKRVEVDFKADKPIIKLAS